MLWTVKTNLHSVFTRNLSLGCYIWNTPSLSNLRIHTTSPPRPRKSNRTGAVFYKCKIRIVHPSGAEHSNIHRGKSLLEKWFAFLFVWLLVFVCLFVCLFIFVVFVYFLLAVFFVSLFLFACICLFLFCLSLFICLVVCCILYNSVVLLV